MSLMMRTASATALAWKPVLVMLVISSATVMSWSVWLLNSTPETSWAFGATGAEGLRTALVERVGACVVGGLLGLVDVMMSKFQPTYLSVLVLLNQGPERGLMKQVWEQEHAFA